MEGKWAPQIGKENKYQHGGKELNEEFGLNWSDFGARFYDPAIGRWNHIDPLAEAYQGYSPYNYVLNNPINSIDPDGRDVIHLIDGSAPFGTGLSGHTAVLIGNDDTGWTLYSKSGGENNPDGTAQANISTFKNLQDFQDQYGRSGSYKFGYRVKTTTDQDAKMVDFANSDIYSPYELVGNNCSNFCRSVIESGGVNMGERQSLFGLSFPYFEHQEFAASNPEGTNLFFTGDGTTPESIENAFEGTGKGNRDASRRNKNAFLFSQIVGDNGSLKVEEGTYKFDENMNLIRQDD